MGTINLMTFILKLKIMKPVIITNGAATSVDWNEYDLSLEDAAKELHEGRNIIAREFEDFTDDFSFPEVDELNAVDYSGKSIDEIIECIRGYYESFGKAKQNE